FSGIRRSPEKLAWREGEMPDARSRQWHRLAMPRGALSSGPDDPTCCGSSRADECRAWLWARHRQACVAAGGRTALDARSFAVRGRQHRRLQILRLLSLTHPSAVSPDLTSEGKPRCARASRLLRCSTTANAAFVFKAVSFGSAIPGAAGASRLSHDER